MRSPDEPDQPAEPEVLTAPADPAWVDAVVLEGAELDGAQLEGLSATDVRVAGGSLANARARRSRWLRVRGATMPVTDVVANALALATALGTR